MGGALVAHELTTRGRDVVLVEKRHIASGSSSASTGLIQYASDKSLTSCMHSFGEQAGLRFYKLCQEAVIQLGSICRDLAIDPQFIPRKSLYFASCEEDVPQLREDYAQLKRHGFDVRFLESDDIASTFSFRKPAAILSGGDAEVNPLRLTWAIVQSAAVKGLRVYQETAIRRHHATSDHIMVYTQDERTIKASYVVFATGYETQEIKVNPNTVLESTYVIATQPLDDFSGWLERCLIWETARPYLYLRKTTDNRIVAGGLDEGTNIEAERDSKLPHKIIRLLQEVQKLFPHIPQLRAEYGWAATFGRTHDGLPLIGPQKGFPRCHFLMGYGGNGTVYSMIGAQIIADLIEHGSNPDAHLFRIDRPHRSVKRS
ncbi:MAG: FAD-binding oxidoreductase [Gorillibacterium sp.]|nr:FAD-binding oxidoreductase [Gorillibacterium sp.]